MHVRLEHSSPAPSSAIVGLICVLLAGLGLSLSANDAHAKKVERRVFVFDRLDLPEGAPAELESIVRKKFLKAIESEAKLLAELPKEAPPIDPKDKGQYGNKAFKKYMKAHRLTAFKVVVQITEYKPSVAPNDNNSGNIVGTSIKLRMFGETLPDRVMAFSGDGSSKVLIEVGKKVRDRDRSVANEDAIELAMSEALVVSLTKLNAKPARKKKRGKK